MRKANFTLFTLIFVSSIFFINLPEKVYGCCGSGEASAMSQESSSFKTFDPVCKMEVKRTETTFTKKYKGRTYYFCSERCLERFEKSPKLFACVCLSEHEGCACSHCGGEPTACNCSEGREEHKHKDRAHEKHEGDEHGGHHH